MLCFSTSDVEVILNERKSILKKEGDERQQTRQVKISGKDEEEKRELGDGEHKRYMPLFPSTRACLTSWLSDHSREPRGAKESKASGLQIHGWRDLAGAICKDQRDKTF